MQEIKRVSGVLEGYLAGQKEEYGARGGGDGPWLVGNKLSYADISFIPWQRIAVGAFGDEGFHEDDFPLVKEWLGKMTSREKVKAVLEKS